jgi:hypothetical protein
MQSSTEFTARKMLTSSPNNRYLECLIALKRSLIDILKRKGLKNTSLWDPERTSKGEEKVCKMRTEDCRLLTFNYDTSSRTRMKMHEVVKQNRMPDKVKWTAKVKIETI